MAYNNRGMQQRGPPLASRPPYATDEPDSYYDSAAQQRQRRVPREKEVDPNARTSAYNVYNHYLDEKDTKDEKRLSGIGAAFMNDDSDDEDDTPPPAYANKPVSPASREVPNALKPATGRGVAATHVNPRGPPSPSPIAAPRPGYAAPIAALNLPTGSPSPQLPSMQPQMRQAPRAPPAALALAQSNYGHAPGPGMPPSPALSTPPSVPSTPHPLQAPLTPIMPAFARPRPPKTPPADRASKVHFASTPIMRSGSEDGLLPRRGEKGDDFWRRFSMVYKEERQTGGKKSTWLKKTENGSSRLSRWVWVVGLLLVACIGGAIFLGYWFTQNTSGQKAPKAIGGSANEPASVSSASSSSHSGSSSPHVSPTNTVARRVPEPVITAIPIAHADTLAIAHPELEPLPNPVAAHRKRHAVRALR